VRLNVAPLLYERGWEPFSNGSWAFYQGAGYSWVSPYHGMDAVSLRELVVLSRAGWDGSPAAGEWVEHASSLIASNGLMHLQPPQAMHRGPVNRR